MRCVNLRKFIARLIVVDNLLPLNKNTQAIRDAFDNRKSALRNGTSRKQVKSVELQKALERIERLDAENQRLKNENEALLSQFVRWAYNAHSK